MKVFGWGTALAAAKVVSWAETNTVWIAGAWIVERLGVVDSRVEVDVRARGRDPRSRRRCCCQMSTHSKGVNGGNETRRNENTYPACTGHGLIAISSGSCGLSSVVVFNVAERKCSRKPTHTRGTLRTRQLQDEKPFEQSETIAGIRHDLSFVQEVVCTGDVLITGKATREMR